MDPGIKKTNLNQKVFYLLSPEFLKIFYAKNFLHISKIYFENLNLVFTKVSIQNIVFIEA